VNSTALDGIKEGFRVRVLFDAIRAVDLEQGDGERAIAEVMAELKKNPVTKPTRPAYPNYHKRGTSTDNPAPRGGQ